MESALSATVASTVGSKIDSYPWRIADLCDWYRVFYDRISFWLGSMLYRTESKTFISCRASSFEIYLKYVTQQSSFSSSQRRRGAVRVQGFERINVCCALWILMKNNWKSCCSPVFAILSYFFFVAQANYSQIWFDLLDCFLKECCAMVSRVKLLSHKCDDL